jgi:hypothetical protein
MLRPLADNGGLTQTHALSPGSPAIDGGNCQTVDFTDQRGLRRPAPCDIGAYEYGVPWTKSERTSLRFAATRTGGSFAAQTAAQSVRLTTVGDGIQWTATADAPWLTVTPATGSGSGMLSVAVKFDASLPVSGTANADVTLATTGPANTLGAIAVALDIVPGTTAASIPFGSFDTPVSHRFPQAGSIAITGWALDNVGVKQVELWRDLQPGESTPIFAGTATDPRTGKVFIANANFVDGARPDVESLYPTTPASYRAGWGYLLLTQSMGDGAFKLWAFAVDEEDNIATFGSKDLVVDNTAATKPFGSIDTPGIGGVAGTLPNFGWALTPKVNGAATCKIQPSGVQVSIDSGPLQPVIYGDVRPDILGAFPGFSNSAAAGGHLVFDWSSLTNGLHTIGWLVRDDCGRAEGIGSRFFTVTNGTNLWAAPGMRASGTAQVGENIESDAPLLAARGYGELPQVVQPGIGGSRTVEIKQGERIELRTPRGFETAYQLANGQQRALPAGSSWDAPANTFSWQPAPGFLGRYRLVFSNGRERFNVRIVVIP